jgi:hypothetical protein
MQAGESIYAGGPDQGKNYCMCDPNGWALYMQTDGNLVIYNQAGVPQWSSRTTGGDANSSAIMQSDGNFVIYDNGVPRWASNTSGHPGAVLAFQNYDGNLVVYSSTGQPLWASHT